MSANDYTFTTDWFSSNVRAWNELLIQLKPLTMLEIGSFEGRSACYLIENCSQFGPVEIYCIDTWSGGVEYDGISMKEVEARFDVNVEIARGRAQHAVEIHKVRKPSFAALAAMLSSDDAPVLDLVYIDGSHQAPDVLADAVLSFSLLRPGGVMIFDDYLWHLGPMGSQDSLNMPKPAVDAFVNLFQRKLNVVQRMPLYQLYLQKTDRWP